VRPLRYYVETSVWNFLLETQRPERHKVTTQFFQQVKGPEALVISNVVLREIARAPQPRRHALEQLIQRYGPTVLEEKPRC
jgi:hypothetical protein